MGRWEEVLLSIERPLSLKEDHRIDKDGINGNRKESGGGEVVSLFALNRN